MSAAPAPGAPAPTVPPEPAATKPIGTWRKLMRSTAFRLTVAYMLIFTVFAAGILVYVAWNARRVIDDQIRLVIEAEITGLAEQNRIGGLRRLMAVIEQRSRAPGASLYLLTSPFGERLAGNVSVLPPGILDKPGEIEIPYALEGDQQASAHRALVRVYLLPAGFRLLVGRDLDERLRIRAAVQRAGGWSLILVLVLGSFGGWVVTRRVLRRVDGMTETAQNIMSGDLKGRLAVAGTGDELDRLALNLNAMLDRMGELMTGLRQVSDNIAHDLKTPLTRLRNRAEEALRTPRGPEELRTALDGVIEDADNLIRVFNALLMIARLEAGQVRESMGPMDGAELAQSVGELYEPLAEDAGATLTVTAAANAGFTGNRELVGQALANLLDNAIKYGQPAEGQGPPAVMLSVAAGPESVTFTVADRGPGIPEADRARVLERFVRLDGARTRPGFGLGLALAAGVARLHGGSLSLEDNAPGLLATLTLPRAR
jgi:signal transduction histidine kinase